MTTTLVLECINLEIAITFDGAHSGLPNNNMSTNGDNVTIIILH